MRVLTVLYNDRHYLGYFKRLLCTQMWIGVLNAIAIYFIYFSYFNSRTNILYSCPRLEFYYSSVLNSKTTGVALGLETVISNCVGNADVVL